MDDLSKVATGDTRFKRPIYTFQVPEKLARTTGIKSVGLVELTGGEELIAAKLAGSNALQLGQELAKASLKQINGKNLDSDEVDDFYSRPDVSKLRTLVVTAYAKVNQPESEDTANFLGSMVTSVGETR